MHDTAYRIGGLVLGAYLPASPSKILEIGALNVNGTLRSHSPRNAEYTGLDFEAGDGVDAVITGHEDWEVPDANFDLVIASSVFEHDPLFWKTFLAMCRKAKPGGHVYINAPSNGTVHRYPRDYWRFYPDAGLALEELGRAEGFDLTLIESFIAERENDCWNDFCAVFRVGPSSDDLNCDFVHTKVKATNAMSWRSSLIINPLNDPEDMRLLHLSLEDGQNHRAECEALREELQSLRLVHEQVEIAAAEREALQDELRRTREANQKDATTWQDQIKFLNQQINALRNNLRQQKDSYKSEIFQIASTYEQQVTDALSENELLKDTIHEKDNTISFFNANEVWLRRVILILTRDFSASFKARLGGFLPSYFAKKQKISILSEQGLFDQSDYLAANPDVAQSGNDPLRHYVNHGMAERRSLSTHSVD